MAKGPYTRSQQATGTRRGPSKGPYHASKFAKVTKAPSKKGQVDKPVPTSG